MGCREIAHRSGRAVDHIISDANNTPATLTTSTAQAVRQQIIDLAKHLDHLANRVPMHLGGDRWHIDGKVPPTAGWYFIETNTPIEVLQRQHRPQTTYAKKRTGKVEDVKIYDLAGSAARYANDLDGCWNTKYVYSGLAQKLQSRAREHTLPDLGTAALGLGLYPELREYEWTFCYVEMGKFLPNASCPKMLLALGEQIWRANNGWPLLCRA